jgi:hypothetical protein
MTREQVVREPMWAAALMGAGFVLAGAGAVAGTSWLLRLVANWLVTVPGMPVPVSVRILAALPEPQGRVTPCDLREQRLADAFGRHGYRWLDGDPYAADFRR